MPTPIANLEIPPTAKDEHLWADYIEMLTIQNPDGEISKSYILDRLQERKDLGEAEYLSKAFDDTAKYDDRTSLFITDCFEVLNSRATTFTDAYPFVILESRNTLKCKASFTTIQKIYIFLLLAANLRIFSKTDSNEISSAFEVVSLEALKNYLPPHAKTIFFGKNPRNNHAGYNGKIFTKIMNLATELKEQSFISENDFDPRDTGDRGLDLVGYVPFNDSASGMLYVFVQCACTDEWVDKQHQPSEGAWNNLIRFTAKLPHMIFIPFCYRNAMGGWHDYTKIGKSILVDRVRLIDFIIRNPSSVDTLKDLPIVDLFIAERESLY